MASSSSSDVSKSAPSSPKHRPNMSLFEVKNAMQAHMLADSHTLSALRGIMHRLKKQRSEYVAEIEQLRATGRRCTNLDNHYVSYLQDKIGKLDTMMDSFVDTHHSLRDFIYHAEFWQGEVDPEKSVDEIRRPSNYDPRHYDALGRYKFVRDF